MTFVEDDGTEIKVEAELGATLLEVAHDNDVELEGESPSITHSFRKYKVRLHFGMDIQTYSIFKNIRSSSIHTYIAFAALTSGSKAALTIDVFVQEYSTHIRLPFFTHHT